MRMRFLAFCAAQRGRRAALLAAALGALSAAALPPVHALPVLLVALPGLLLLIGGQNGLRPAAWCGFWFGFGQHLFGLYWITEAILVEIDRFWWLVPFAVPMTAVVLGLFTAAACALARRAAPGLPRAATLAGALVFADLGRQFVATGFPWNLWGSVWAVPGGIGDVMLQPAAWIGVHGLSLLTLLVAASPALGGRAMAASCGGLLLWIGAGEWRLRTAAVSPAPGLTVVLVQGNVAQGQKQDRAMGEATFDRELALTVAGVTGIAGPAVVVWPETASPYLLEVDANARAAIAAASGHPALVGSVRFDADRRPRNSLMAITGAGPPAAIYDKWHLVPFGEYQPSWMPLPIQVVPGGGFAAGPGPRSLHVPGLPAVGAMICYEAIFPGQAVDETDRPDWLVNVTNDAWFGNSSGPRQHLAAVRMRAVETGLPVMRAANTGISAGFDALGRELGRIGMNRAGSLALVLPGHLPMPLFARAGLLLPFLLAAMLTSPAISPRRILRNDNKN